ncbi:hypothetical protein HanIR_Chr08g0360441 [Helianthus annuus]|nr:hypothetical protein HanIR_Chr08g0360441 [Helianthus annuus]
MVSKQITGIDASIAISTAKLKQASGIITVTGLSALTTQPTRKHHFPEKRFSDHIYSIHHFHEPVSRDRIFMLKSIRNRLESEVGVAAEPGQHLGVAEKRAVDVFGVEEGDTDARKT